MMMAVAVVLGAVLSVFFFQSSTEMFETPDSARWLGKSTPSDNKHQSVRHGTIATGHVHQEGQVSGLHRQ